MFSLFLLLSGDYYIAIQSDSFNGEWLSWHSITRPYCLCYFVFFRLCVSLSLDLVYLCTPLRFFFFSIGWCIIFVFCFIDCIKNGVHTQCDRHSSQIQIHTHIYPINWPIDRSATILYCIDAVEFGGQCLATRASAPIRSARLLRKKIYQHISHHIQYQYAMRAFIRFHLNIWKW